MSNTQTTFSIGLLTINMGSLGHVLSAPKTPAMERKYHSYIGYTLVSGANLETKEFKEGD